MTASLTRALVKGVAWFALLAGCLVALQAQTNAERVGSGNDNLSEPTYAQALADERCTPAAEGELPGAVVVTMKDRVTAVYTRNTELIGQAMDHALAGVDNDVWSVTAFCA